MIDEISVEDYLNIGNGRKRSLNENFKIWEWKLEELKVPLIDSICFIGKKGQFNSRANYFKKLL